MNSYGGVAAGSPTSKDPRMRDQTPEVNKLLLLLLIWLLSLLPCTGLKGTGISI